jgi:nicotinamidase-related amidase
MEVLFMNEAINDFKQQLLQLAPVHAADFLDGKTALVIVDMVNGFLTQGTMASPRCAAVLPAVEALLQFSAENALACIAFADCHTPGCTEFSTFPPHCISGTAEAEIAPSLCKIGGFLRIEKNSTNGFLVPAFQEFLQSHPSLTRIIVCGVCTDICVMQFALSLKAFCNQINRTMEVLVPENTVATYDAPAHNGEMMQTAALNIMQQAGIRLVKEVIYHG